MKEKNGAAYCRVSTVLECQEDSLGWQEQHYTKMLSESKNIRFVGVYSDDHSGQSIHDRPGFQKMLEDCETGKIDVIYTKSISRFSRNIVDCATVVRHLKDLGISVFFEKEGINSGDDQCEMLFNILTAFAQEESRRIGINIASSIAERHARGIPTGRVTYGYRCVDKKGHWQVEEAEARRVRYAFDLAAKGVCYADIRAGLDDMEQSEDSGVSWSQNRNRVAILLRNATYTGDYVTDTYFTAYGKNGRRYSRKNRGERDQYCFHEHHEAIISKEQFEQVQAYIQAGILHSGRKLTNQQKKVIESFSALEGET